MNQFFHVCDCYQLVQEDTSGVQDCGVLAMSVLCLTFNKGSSFDACVSAKLCTFRVD